MERTIQRMGLNIPTELSKVVAQAGKKLSHGKANDLELGYLFFEKGASCTAIFELLKVRPKWLDTGLIRRPELMNAIWRYGGVSQRPALKGWNAMVEPVLTQLVHDGRPTAFIRWVDGVQQARYAVQRPAQGEGFLGYGRTRQDQVVFAAWVYAVRIRLDAEIVHAGA